MRITLDSPATPILPISMLLSPVVRLRPASAPKAVLPLPVLFKSALIPMAVFVLPVSLAKSALKPTPVLKPPVVLVKTAATPMAVLTSPSVLLKSELAPVAVFCAPG